MLMIMTTMTTKIMSREVVTVDDDDGDGGDNDNHDGDELIETF